MHTPMLPDDKVSKASTDLVKSWYAGLENVEPGRDKVVYLYTAGGISELFRSFGFQIVLPEITAIRCSRHRMSAELVHDAENLGYSTDICSYVKSDLGLMAGPRKGKTPFGQIPPPDLIVVTNSGCSAYIKWADALSRQFNCPVKLIDIPFVREDRLSDFDLSYVRGQIGELIPACEEVSGVKFDSDKLSASLDLTRQAIDLWVSLLEKGKNIPSPFDGYFEAVSYMAPMTIWRGTQDAVDFYKFANDEIDKKIADHYSPSGKENFRLLFEGYPPWPEIREFREMFMQWGAVGVTSTYVRVGCVCEELHTDIEDPLDFLSDLASQSYYNWNLAKRRSFITSLARDYNVDGIIMHSVRSCRPFSIGQLDMRNYFAREAAIPSLFLDSDLANPRYFSSAQIRSRVNTFFEALADNRIKGANA